MADFAGDVLGAEDTADLIVIGIIFAIVAFVVYEIFKFFNDSGATNAVSEAASGVGQYVHPTDPTSNGTLFWDGVNNFFTTGSIYGAQQ